MEKIRRELPLPIRHSIHGLHLFHASLVQKSWGCKNDNNGYELVLCVQFRTITIMNGSSENPVHTEKLQLMFWFIVRKEKWKGLSTYITFEHRISMYDLSCETISITFTIPYNVSIYYINIIFICLTESHQTLTVCKVPT